MNEIDTSTEAIAALMDGVTPGPWTEHDKGKHQNAYVCGATERYEHGDDKPVVVYVVGMNVEANRRFISAARDLVPALAAERDALRAEIERLRDAASKLAEALRWYISEDETNEGEDYLPDFGGSWNDINDYWIAGKRRASESLASWEAAQK